MTKCAVVANILQPCSSLDRAMDQGPKKGITHLDLWNFETHMVSMSMAVLRSGNLPKTGAVVNYCPFCGESISHHCKVKEEVNSNEPGGRT